MDKNNNSSQSMEEKYGVIEITNENKHLYPELKDELQFLEDNPGKIFFPEKYFKAQKDELQIETKALWEKSPHLPLKQVLLAIMEPLPDFLPADNLVEVTKIITSFWEELKKEKLAA